MHIHAARAAAAMHQNPVLGGFSPAGAAWAAAAAAARPGAAGALEAFNAANMLYGGPPAPPSFPPPPGFLGPHMMDSMTAERLAQQQVRNASETQGKGFFWILVFLASAGTFASTANDARSGIEEAIL